MMREYELTAFDSTPLCGSDIQNTQLMLGLRPAIDSEVDRLQGVVKSLTNQGVYFHESDLPLASVAGKIVHSLDARVCL